MDDDSLFIDIFSVLSVYHISCLIERTILVFTGRFLFATSFRHCKILTESQAKSCIALMDGTQKK
jgi:hypothetical protein